MKTIKVGSRESRLAVIQTQMVIDAIKKSNPELNVEMVTMKTTGDIILDKTLDKIGGKGLFVKELDRALLEKKVDLTVHSFKDMPMDIPNEIPIIATGKREDSRDVLILPKGVEKIDFSLPIGSSSARRTIQLKKLYPQAEIKPVRGNVITRLEKLDSGQYSALVLAAAGIKRLGLENRISRYFDPSEIIPANCQGVVVVQAHKDFDISVLGDFADEKSWHTSRCERAFVKYLDGGCSAPIAAYSTIEGENITLTGLYVCEEEFEKMKHQEERGISASAPRIHTKTVNGNLSQATELGKNLAAELKKEGECMRKGQVTLVGAGPGDKGLLTLKGAEKIQEAEVVIYDRLVGQGILGMIPSNATKINVGKKASQHLVPQEEINKLILKYALEGKKVVRLKGGDSFMFGRGGEELELLVENEIKFEVVPGITSAIAVPAYAGIPVTHRDYCSSLHIITGHAKAGKEIDIDYKALTEHGGTLVFLMGLSAIEELMNGLLKAGMSKDMPAATIEKGTTTHQRKIVSTVEKLADKVRNSGIKSPAITVVGKVCTLSEKFDWFSKKPLKGTTIIVTRPKERIGTLSDRLREKGSDVIEYPCIETHTIFEKSKFENSVENINQYDWMAFTSPSGVDSFFEKLKYAKIDIRRFFGLKIAAVGKETKRKLEEKNLVVDYMPEIYDSKNLAQGLNELKPSKILVLRANLGSNTLTDTLKKSQINFDEIHIYNTEYVNQEAEQIMEMLIKNKADYVTFTSASTVTGFTKSILATTPDFDFSNIKAVCIGQQTAFEAQKYNMQINVSKEATVDSMIEEIEILNKINSLNGEI